LRRPNAFALLLDGGGSGGGVAAELKSLAQVGLGAEPSHSPHLTAHTTIPGPSSVEEEGGLMDTTRQLNVDPS
jgi:hypothetical protein